jgi:hypothetical protein
MSTANLSGKSLERIAVRLLAALPILAAATSAPVRIAGRVGRNAAPSIQVDSTARFQDCTELLTPPLHAARHAREGDAGTLSRLLLCRTFQVDDSNGLLLEVYGPGCHAGLTASISADATTCSAPLPGLQSWTNSRLCACTLMRTSWNPASAIIRSSWATGAAPAMQPV